MLFKKYCIFDRIMQEVKIVNFLFNAHEKNFFQTSRWNDVKHRNSNVQKTMLKKLNNFWKNYRNQKEWETIQCNEDGKIHFVSRNLIKIPALSSLQYMDIPISRLKYILLYVWWRILPFALWPSSSCSSLMPSWNIGLQATSTTVNIHAVYAMILAYLQIMPSDTQMHFIVTLSPNLF